VEVCVLRRQPRTFVFAVALGLSQAAAAIDIKDPPANSADGAEMAVSNKQARVLTIRDDKIVLPEPIKFKAGKAEVLADSHWVLDSVAATLETHLDICQLEVGVHSDSRGSGAYNKRITQKRADRIRAYLIGKGIDKKRLHAKGFGEEYPIDSNQTAAGRAKNRRVELVIRKRC
jgi:outer membrane protein OmpA-like peptidoglycan-associated protein